MLWERSELAAKVHSNIYSERCGLGVTGPPSQDWMKTGDVRDGGAEGLRAGKWFKINLYLSNYTMLLEEVADLSMCRCSVGIRKATKTQMEKRNRSQHVIFGVNSLDPNMLNRLKSIHELICVCLVNPNDDITFFQLLNICL